MKICIIGTGYVGLVTGVCFADLGNIVHCVDNNIAKINMLNRGPIPIYEPGLEEMVKRNYEDKRLIFTTDLKKAVTYSDIIFICVGTPTIKNSNSVDLKYVFRVVNDIRKYLFFLIFFDFHCFSLFFIVFHRFSKTWPAACSIDKTIF